MTEHPFWDLASVPVETATQAQIEELLRLHRWREAHRTHAADHPGDIEVWRLIRCEDDFVILLRLILTYAIWSADEVVSYEVLAGSDMKELLELADDEWARWPKDAPLSMKAP